MANVLIVSIDPGTTGFKTAHTTAEEAENNRGRSFLKPDTDNEHIFAHTGYPGNLYEESTEIATTLIYGPQGQLLKWGHLAAKDLDSNEVDHDYVVNHWKLGLHQATDPTGSRLQQNLEAAARRIWQGTKQPRDFAQDFFRALGKYLFSDETSILLQDQGGTLENYKFVDIVVAVPPGWARHEHRMLMQAATLGIGQKPGWRIFAVSETECVLRAWLKQPGRKGRTLLGDVVVLLDLGGGTACISVFKYEFSDEGERKWTHIESHSLSAGSELVTEEFIKDFQSRLETVGFPQSAQLLHQAREMFNKKKRSVGDKDETDMLIDVKGLKRDNENEFLEDKMIVTCDRARRYFKPSQDLLLDKIDEVATRITKNHGLPKYCVVAGAYAKNLLFRQRLKALNEKFAMEIFYPQNGQELVVRGACYARLQGDFHEYAGSRLSVGILTYVRWSEIKEICPRAHRRKFNGDVRWWSPVISWAIKKGASINRNRPISHDGRSFRKRYFEENESIEFTETILVSEAHPGSAKFTVLKHSTSTPATWMENYKDLNERKIPIDATRFTWKLSETRITEADGTWRSLDRTSLRLDPRIRKRYLEYRYFLEVTQTDCRVAIEAKFTGNRCERRYVGLLGMGDFESEALQEEYDDHRPPVAEDLPEVAPHLSDDFETDETMHTASPRTPLAAKRKATEPNEGLSVRRRVSETLVPLPQRQQPSLRDPASRQRILDEESEEDDSDEDVIPPRRTNRNRRVFNPS